MSVQKMTVQKMNGQAEERPAPDQTDAARKVRPLFAFAQLVALLLVGLMLSSCGGAAMSSGGGDKMMLKRDVGAPVADLTAVALAGPFDSVDALCESAGYVACTDDAAGVLVSDASLASGVTVAGHVYRGESAAGEKVALFGLRTESGYWQLPSRGSFTLGDSTMLQASILRLEEFEEGLPGRVLVRSQVHLSTESETETTWDATIVDFVCDAQPEAAPHCVAMVAGRGMSTGAAGEKSSTMVENLVLPRGEDNFEVLRLHDAKGSALATEVQQEGVYHIVFPRPAGLSS